MTHGSLFSGIGGFDLAAREAGLKNLFQVEIDDYCHKVLNKNFPDVKKYRDVKEFNGLPYRYEVDILSGGFPCQDISIQSNTKTGLKGERSGLFYQMIRIASEVKPSFIVWENSPQTIHLLPEIIKEFKDINYVSWQKILSARDLGYPHLRRRMYGVAFANAYGFGFDACKDFSQKFTENYKSEVQRLQRRTKTQFTRTFSRALLEETDTEILRNADGLSGRLDADRIKGLGNAIIPKLAEIIFRALISTFYKMNSLNF